MINFVQYNNGTLNLLKKDIDVIPNTIFKIEGSLYEVSYQLLRVHLKYRNYEHRKLSDIYKYYDSILNTKEPNLHPIGSILKISNQNFHNNGYIVGFSYCKPKDYWNSQEGIFRAFLSAYRKILRIVDINKKESLEEIDKVLEFTAKYYGYTSDDLIEKLKKETLTNFLDAKYSS